MFEYDDARTASQAAGAMNVACPCFGKIERKPAPAPRPGPSQQQRRVVIPALDNKRREQ